MLLDKNANELTSIKDRLATMLGKVAEIHVAEEDHFDSMSDDEQASEAGEALHEALNELDDLHALLDEALEIITPMLHGE